MTKEQRKRKRENRRKWYERNRKRIRESSRKWYLKNRERVIESSRKWSLKNREHTRKYLREWRKKNAKHVQELIREWRKENIERVRKYEREYYRGHPQICAKRRKSDKRRYHNDANYRNRRLAEARRYQHKNTLNITNLYVRRLLIDGGGIEAKDIPGEIIEVKRAHLLLVRQIKQSQKGEPS